MMRLTTLRWAPLFAQGLVRDLRPRWALEETGIPYTVRAITQEEQASVEYRQLQPFGQVPVLEEGNLTLFESGSIVLHIAEKTKVLLPATLAGRARAHTWVFAALNSIEPFITNLGLIDLFYAKEEWAKQSRPATLARVKDRLMKLATWLEGREYLENDGFTAGDLVMTTVLRNLRHTEIVEEFPVLETYKKRCEARPAFQKALADQMKLFAENAPKESALR